MIIKALVENTASQTEYKTEHGLSLYIETKTHKILFDLGMSDLFLENAKKLNIDISEIDIVVISHGHHDHGGGLDTFLKTNAKAKIYLHEKAFEKHYSARENSVHYIGLDENLKENERFIFTQDYLKIDDELELFSNAQGNELSSKSNKVLLMENGDETIEDTFEHEQSLIITEAEKTVLLAGCAHKGIVNILNRAIQIKKRPPNYVFGGFHLYNPNTKISESLDLIEQIGLRLNDTGAKCYTCHCTGIKPYEYLKEIMKENIAYMATGNVVEI